MRLMTVSDEIRTRLSQWCAARVTDEEREQRQVAYTIQGDDVTIVERRPPAFPELGHAWSAVPVARLRKEDGGMWTLFWPVEGGEWRREACGDDPIALLDEAANS
ncbi:hypothetical protein GCM10009609_12440 [Pseudonocardia aurantiaca]